MNLRSPFLASSIFKSRAFLRRPSKRAALALTLALLWLNQHASAANTEFDVINGQTDLTNAAGTTYKTGGTPGTGVGGTTTATVPSVTSDVTFDSGVTYAPTAFTLNSSETFGSLDDLSATALTIANTSTTGTGDTLTLGGAGDLGDGVPGSAAGDLLFVATGSTLTINSGAAGTATALGLVLGQSGNFDVAGTGAATIASVISDGGNAYSITKTGTGGLTLSGANTFSGGVFLQAGTIFAKSAAAFGTGALSLGASSGTAGALVNYNGGSNLTVTNAINVNAGSTGTLEIEATSGAPTLSGLVTLANNLTLVNTNTAGANSFNLTGGVAGTGNLIFAASSAGGFVLGPGGTVNFTGTISNVGTGGAGFGISANLTGAESLLQNSATSITTLSGTNTNTGTDTSMVGVLDFAKPVSLFNGVANATTANLIVLPGATAAFQIGASNFTAANIATLNALGSASGGFENGSLLGIDTTPGSFTYATAITNNNGGANAIGLNKVGANTLTLTATNTYSGETLVTAGTLQVGAGGTAGTLGTGSVVDNATLTFDRSDNYGGAFTQSIGGTGALSVIGTGGTLTLSGVNIFTGATTVTAGTLDVANSLALENSTLTPPTTGGVLTFDAGVTSNAFTVGALTGTAANNLALQNNAATPAGITLTVGSEGNNASTTYTGILSGAGGLTRAGIIGDTLTLTGANTYTGATTLAGGTINLGNGGATGSISSSSPLVLAGGTLAYTNTASGATQTFNGTTIQPGASLITESLAGQTLNLGAITHTVNGGAVDFGSTGTINTTTTANVNGILGGYATFGGRTTWAVAPATSGGAITGLATYTPTATAGTAPANYAAQNIDVTAAETLTGGISPNSVRFNSATALTLTLTGVNTITSGGILVTPTATAGGAITGGTLVGSAAGDLVVSNGDNTAGVSGMTALSIGSLVVDNGTAATTVSMNGVNNRVALSLSNAANSFSGGLFVNEGVVSTSTSGTPLGTGNITISPDGYTGSGGSLALNGSPTVATGLLVDVDGVGSGNGNIANGGGTFVLTLIGSGSATFNGVIASYSGGRVINPVLDSGTQIFGNTNVGTSLVTVNGGTLQVGNGYLGTFANSANNVGLAVGGGTFNLYGPLSGTVTQVFNSGVAVNAGASTVSVTNNSGAGALLTLNALTRNAGGTVNFVEPGGTLSAVNGITTTTLNTNGILGGYATVGGADWATNATNTAGGNLIGLSSSTINAYTPSTAGTTAPGTGTNVDFQASNTTALATQSVNSLRFNTAGSNTLSVADGNTLTVSSGGILETANVGNNATTISGGTLVGSAQDLVVIQNNATGVNSALTINSAISGGGLTKSGAGELILAPQNGGGFPVNNTFTGGVYLNGGILNTNQNGINGAGSLAFNGGTLQASSGLALAKPITIGATGGTIDTDGNTVALTGNVTGAIVGAGAFGGFVSTGAFALRVNDSVGGGVLTLGGTNSAFNGGIVIGNGTVQAGSATGLGTGYVGFVNSTVNTPTLDLNGFSPTLAGLRGVGANGVVTNSSATAATLTLNGVTTRAFGGSIQDGAGTIGLTVALNSPLQTQTLTGASTYSGATTVNVGGLFFNDSLTPATAGASTAVTVSSTTAGGGTLGGSGMLTVSSVTVNAGGTLAPGAIRGATAGTLTLNTTSGITLNGTLQVGITATGGTILATNGALSLGSTSILNVTGTAGASAYDIANYGTTETGTFNAMVIPTGYTLNYAGNTFNPLGDIELDLAAVPEPSTWAMLVLGGVVWQYRRRNRRSVG